MKNRCVCDICTKIEPLVPTREARLEAALRKAIIAIDMALEFERQSGESLMVCFSVGCDAWENLQSASIEAAALLPESAEQATKGGI